MNDKVLFDALPIDEKFKKLFDEYKREIQEKVLYDVLIRFYFADWTRACDYENMTAEEVVNAAMEVCHKIEKDYNYDIDDDILPNPFSGPYYDVRIKYEMYINR